MNELEELGESLLDKSDDAKLSCGGGIVKRYFSYVVQCPSGFDNRSYPTLEEATKRWLQLKFEGKI